MTATPPTAPYLGELLKESPTNWGKWGADDEVGALNYLGPEQVLDAPLSWSARARSSRCSGSSATRRVTRCGRDAPLPSAPRSSTRSSWDGADAPAFPGGLHYADDKINAFLQGSTQYDALGHVWYDGKIWNGYDARTSVGGLDKASVEPIAQRGVVGRAVLLDMARHPRQGEPGRRRDLHARGPAGLRRGSGHDHRQARHPDHPDQLPEAVLRSW